MEKLFNGMTYPEAHKALWTWISENPTKPKGRWFKEQLGDERNDITANCFACEIASIKEYCVPLCQNCPLCNVGNENRRCLNGLYDGFLRAKKTEDYKEVSRIALIIANLPWIEKEAPNVR